MISAELRPELCRYLVVVLKDWLRLSLNRHSSILTSYNLEEIWNDVMVCEGILCAVCLICQCVAAVCIEFFDNPDWLTGINHILMFLLTILDLFLQITMSCLLYVTDL